MGIYLGLIGNIELTRTALEGAKQSILNPDDINPQQDRFSFDFEEGYLVTGDFIEITTTDGTNLDFIDTTGWANGTVHSSGAWYIFVDELDGIKLYTSFAASLDGGTAGRVPLVAINRNIPINVIVRDRESRVLGDVIEYELNTNRETVDITTLSDEYRQQYSSLISGSGRLTARWDYTNNRHEEPVNYLMQLVLRTEVGSTFHGRFYIKAPDTPAFAGSFSANQLNDSLWWDLNGIITASAVTFAPDQVITSVIDFISTGPIRLRTSTQPFNRLLQEDAGRVKLEQDGTSFVLLEEPE
jgi:hypothetical protein